MSIDYRKTERTKLNDSFSGMLRETAEYFASKGIQMTNHQGIEEILSESSLFEDYKNHLCEGLEPDQVENFEQLMDNSRMSMLQEAQVSGIQQIAGLSMPTIRKMWAKVALKHAIPTQVVATPRFAISYTKSYIMDSNGNKYELPNAINDLENDKAEMPKLSTAYISIAGGLEDHNLFQYANVPASINNSIDKVFYVETVKATPSITNTSTTPATTTTGLPVEVRIHLKTDLQAILHQRVQLPLIEAANEITVSNPKNPADTKAVYYVDPATGKEYKVSQDANGDPIYVEDTLFGKVDYSAGTLTIFATKGLITDISLNARVSMEANEFGESISFDVLTKDVTIGVGTHINAPLPIEWLQDTMAIYNIDGAAEVVDIMSQTVAQKLEIEIYNFLHNSIKVNNVQYIGQFNMIPSAGYNGTPKSWREELKTVIDWFAIKMKKDSKFHGGKFMIIGSPLDMQLLPNVDWVFNHTNDQMSGVDVSFNLGAFSGAQKYELVSSDLIPDGSLIMFFIPGIDRLMTYKYYPYTFNVERGYRDPNMTNVPSIMMTKRHALEEFTPLICRIDILNNSGQVPATPGY